MRPFLRTKHLLAVRAGVQFQARESSCYSRRCGHHHESRNVKVSVWWDFENCQVPADADALSVAPAITKAVRANGIKGPLRINAFGDVLRLSKPNHHILAHSGIHFTHIPGGKNSADRFLLVNLMDWVSQNPPPAHLFLISGDADFAGILHRLRMNNYNILLASSKQAPDVLCSAATIIWSWSSLVKGEYLSGKHFNHPPDGLLGSWYGNHKATLKKPFSVVDQSTSSRKVDIYEPYNVPKSVVKQVWRVLRSHPKGISIGDLRTELIKCNVSFRNRFYGYGRLSRFLSSIPHVELKPLGDGKFHVHLVCLEAPKPFEGIGVESVTSAKIDEMGAAATPKLNGEDKNKVRVANQTALSNSSHERSMDDDSKSGDSTAHKNKMVSHIENLNLSELDQTVQTLGDFEEPKLSELDQNVTCSGKTGLFSCVSFWNEVESLIFTLKGSLIVSQSKNREDMAHKLRKYEPLVFKSLTEKDILQLVELLISEKKWLEERPSQTFPFRLIQSDQQSSLMNESCNANRLRTLLLNRASQSKFEESAEHDVEKNNQTIPHTKVSATATEMKYMERSRNDILEDCQKLVSDILREHPEGYSISSFPRLFVDKYGYHLDLQKLGYQKLATSLQIMPDIKVESTYIYPSVPAVTSEGETFGLKTEVTNTCHADAVLNSDSELSDSASEDDNMDSPWEELGPVSVNNSNQSNQGSKLSQNDNELDTSTCPDYESIVSDYDSSESERDSSCLNHQEEQGKPTCDEQDSSFWQAPELLHSSTKKSDNVDISGNSLADLFYSSPQSTWVTLSKEKPKSQKNYSFVVEPDIPNEEKMVDWY